MLREYRLTNFKAFGETVTIPIRPLTLIFGANSSGKSSIFQSLLMLKQTLEEAKNPNTALLNKGSLVDLGMYSDFVHRHEMERNFEFEVRFDLENIPILMQTILEHANSEKAGISIQFSGEKERAYPRHVGLAIGEQRQAIISCFRHRRLHPPTQKHPRERFSYQDEVEINPSLEFWRHWYTGTKDYIENFDPVAALLDESDEIEIERGLDDIQKKSDDIEEKQAYLEKLRKYQFEDAIKDLMANMRRNVFDATYRNFLPEKVGKLADNSEGPFDSRRSILDWGRKEEYNGMYNEVDGYDISRFVEPVCSTFRHLLEDLAYIGPLRIQLERHPYTFSGNTSDSVGQSGEYLPSILFQRPGLVEQINKDLERLLERRNKYWLKVRKLQNEDASPSNVFFLRLVDKAGIDTSIRDVGFGISQVLPIVAQSCLSKKKTLLIEQPEIHLHPAQQAELGDMFIRSALEQKNTLLLETHSEHLMLRILRRIRQTTNKDSDIPEGCKISPKDVAVLYVQPGKNGAEVIEIPVTEDGDFKNPWPGGFFEESIKELF